MTENQIIQLKHLQALPEWGAVRAWFDCKEREIIACIKDDPGDLYNPQRLRILDEARQELSA